MNRAALILVASLFATDPAVAAAQVGRIQGRVSDASGLPLPGVTISLTGEAKTPLIVRADDLGRFTWERFQTTTVVGKQDTSISGWTSFTRMDMKPRGSHHVSLRLIVTPDSSSHYGLGAFEPADTVPDLKTTGVSVAATAPVAVGDRSTLDSYVHVKRVQLEGASGEAITPYSPRSPGRGTACWS